MPASSAKIGVTTAKEVSVLAWIQDAYGNVLMVQQTAGKQLWSLPGGKVNSAEALKQALRREIKEEIGMGLLSAKVIDLFDRPEKASLAVLFLAYLGKGPIKLAPAEIKNAAFVAKLPRHATPSARYFWARQLPLIKTRGNVLDI